jgi:type IX secretion system PorP/SprF family membrane protein
MRNFIVILFISVFLPTVLSAQDIHFTQFYTAPLTLNPSFTGNYNGDYRVMNTFRSQWRKFDPGYVTNSLGYDQQVYLLSEKFSGGINAVYDQSGINSFRVIKVNVSMAWHKLWLKNVFHIGMQGGFVIKSYDFSKLTFPDQFNTDNGYFDPQIATAETGYDDRTTYGVINAGIGWHRKMGKHTPSLGFSILNINQPVETFFGSENKLKSRYVITAGNEWSRNDRSVIHPRVLFMEQTKANDFMVGATITRKSKEAEAKISAISYGAFIRNSFNSRTDAVALVAGFRYDLFDVGFSYDINVSEAKTVTRHHGAFELSVVYTALNTRAVKIKIPCERY